MKWLNGLIERGVYNPEFRVITCMLLKLVRVLGDNSPKHALLYAQGLLFASKNKQLALEVLTRLPQPWTLEIQALHQYALFETHRTTPNHKGEVNLQLYRAANTAYSHLAIARYHYQVLRNLDEARLALLRAIHLKPVPEWMMEYSFLCNYLGRDEEAVLWLKQALGLLYEKSAYQLYIGLLLKLKRYDEALAALHHAFKHGGVLMEYAIVLVLLEEFYGNPKIALQWANRVKRLRSKLSPLQRNDLCLYYLYKQKIVGLRRLIRWDLSASLSGTATLVRLLYAQRLQARDLVAESRWYAGVQVEQDPLRVELLRKMAKKATVNEAAFINPYLLNEGAFMPWNIEQLFRAKSKQPKLEGLQFLHEVLSVYPTHPFCHIELAKAQGGRYELSTQFNRGIAQVRHKPSLYLDRARAFLYTQRHDEAHQDLDSFLAFNNNKPSILFYLIKAQVYTGEKLWQKAIYNYKKVAKLADSTDTMYLLAARSIFGLLCQVHSPKKAARKTQKIGWRFHSVEGFLFNAQMAETAQQKRNARRWHRRAQLRKAQNNRVLRAVT